MFFKNASERPTQILGTGSAYQENINLSYQYESKKIFLMELYSWKNFGMCRLSYARGFENILGRFGACLDTCYQCLLSTALLVLLLTLFAVQCWRRSRLCDVFL